MTIQDEQLVAALRRGDADAFATLVDRHSAALIRVAMAYVPSRAAAQEVVQETWIAVMRGIDSFEGRASLKTWIFRILTNIAMRAGARERRSVPFSALAEREDSGGPTVDPDRFVHPGRGQFAGHWMVMPTAWPTPSSAPTSKASAMKSATAHCSPKPSASRASSPRSTSPA